MERVINLQDNHLIMSIVMILIFLVIYNNNTFIYLNMCLSIDFTPENNISKRGNEWLKFK